MRFICDLVSPIDVLHFPPYPHLQSVYSFPVLFVIIIIYLKLAVYTLQNFTYFNNFYITVFINCVSPLIETAFVVEASVFKSDVTWDDF